MSSSGIPIVQTLLENSKAEQDDFTQFAAHCLYVLY